MPRFTVVAIALAALWLAFPKPAAADADPPSNAEVLAGSFVAAIIEQIPDSMLEKRPLLLTADSSTALARWVLQNLQDSCLQRNYLVYSSAENVDANHLKIVISHPSVQIEYRSAGRKWILFSKGVQRQVTGTLHLRVENESNQLLISHQLAVTRTDTIPESFISRAEDDRLPFTRGTKPRGGVVDQWVEPALVGAVSVAVVAMFFTLRSRN